MPPKKKPVTPKLSQPIDSVKHADKRAKTLWAFLKIVDPWDAKNTIRKFIKGEKVDGVGPLLQKESS